MPLRNISHAVVLAVALAYPHLGSANALTPERKAPAKETLPAGTEISTLQVEPAEVRLSGRYESSQIIVTARLAGGEVVDATRMATLVGEGSATISPLGLVHPLRNGPGRILVELAGKQASVPVIVDDFRDTQPVDFIRDVNPVMTKLGCNAGTCHGAKDGKVGFKLSLRGYDPLYDVRSLKDDLAGRRLNSASPDDSLMLLKSTAGVPHEGGQRTRVGEKYYDILRAWIADGARLDMKAPRVARIEVFPKDPVVQRIGSRQQVRIVATYTDGRVRDVTAEAFVESGNGDVAKANEGGLVESLRRGEAPLLARYEGSYAATTLTVMGDRSGFVWKQPETWTRIDELVAQKWERMKIEPSDVCNDTDFLRRVYLDLAGVPPSADDVRAFLADTRPTREKREAIVNKLIGSTEFIEHWTNKWADMLQVNSKFLGAEGAKLFHGWIRKQVEANAPYDQFVAAILTAEGSNKQNPAASYWKILRDPAEAMENTTHLFLATRFNCNKCHDHPFERWTQDQYYHLGAFFSQVKLAPDPASAGAVIVGSAVEKARPLFEIVTDASGGDMMHLRTNKVAEPTTPYPASGKSEGSRRKQLSAWLTSADNRYFASSYVNRLWGYLTGVGLIEPLDDIRAGNPPSNPPLLEYLTREFVEHQFDVRHVMRLICNSRTYQLSLTTNRWNEDDRTNYSHALARRLPSEVLYDSVLKVTGAATKLPGGVRAALLADAGSDLSSGFLANLGRPARESACECERSNELRLGSVMALLSGPAVADAIGDVRNALTTLEATEKDDRKIVDEVFLRVLNRPAAPAEIDNVLKSWGTIEGDHARLIADWETREKQQAPIIAKAEADRLAAIDAAKVELTRYETEIAPKVAEAEAKRVAALAEAEKTSKGYAETKLAAAQTQFEETVPISRTYTGWTAFDPADVSATNKVTLTKLEDGSIRASGVAPRNTDYTIRADTKEAGITGILIEVLPVPDEANFGPGRAKDGNLVLGEIGVKVGPMKGNPTLEAKLTAAKADYQQANFEAAKAIDGKRGDQANGWGLSSKYGVPHYLALKFEKPQGDAAKGVRFRFDLNQPRDGFSIAHFRIWFTTDKDPLQIGLPKIVVSGLRKPAAERSKEENAAITDYWKANDPDYRKLRLTAAKLAMPLPTDPGVLQRREALARAEEPIILDPLLVQLRQDKEQSIAQMKNKRLTGVQDLAWALVNSSAFLFNR